MPTRFQIADESDMRLQLETLDGECSALEKVLGQRAPARPAQLDDDLCANVDSLTQHRAQLRVAVRTTCGADLEGNRSRPGPVKQPQPNDPPPPPPARPTGGTVSLTDQCIAANAPRLALEAAELAKARGVLDKLDADRQAALNAKKAAEAHAAAEYARLNPSLTEQCRRAKAGQS
jgi:hypothetical protein